ncbi:GNAT family N-acetyltransferase [Streptomyces sp. NPDC060194]|uniref:GNAT family N-acetyltransferase n=1 Tax=Streptomyces sp. NPDC060194 TaxID=3347069 RepID=UPI003664AAA1
MLPDQWHLTDDVDALLARAGGFLRSRAALHNTPLTDIEPLRLRDGAHRAAEPALFGHLEAGGEVRAVVYLTPRGRLGLTPLAAARTDALADLLAGLGHAPDTVIADRDTADAFAEAWRRRTGASAARFWRTQLYRLGTLVPPQPAAEGQGRSAEAGDRDHVIGWCREFCVDVDEQRSIDLIDAGRWDASRFGDRHFTLWETRAGVPVSMAAATSVTGGMVRVDPVYTPAEHRGRGYAGAVTAAASRAALAAGATDVVLFTDPDNPTSNALYQRLGFVHLADFAGHRFAYDGTDGPRPR